MEGNTDFSTRKSIDEIIQRAREERDKAINTIEFLLTNKVPTVFSNAQAILDNFAKIAKMLDISYEPNNEEIEELKKSCISTLNILKEQLENVQLAEEDLLSSDVIGNSYTMIEDVSEKLDLVTNRIWKKNTETILSQISKKNNEELENNRLREEKIKLEKEEMYLKGMLDTTILGKKKKELEEKISQIRIKIGDLDKALIATNSFGNNKNDSGINSEKKENIEFE